MVVFVSLAANLLQVHGQRRLPPVTVSILFCLEPAVTAVLDYLLLGNKPSIRAGLRLAANRGDPDGHPAIQIQEGEQSSYA